MAGSTRALARRWLKDPRVRSGYDNAAAYAEVGAFLREVRVAQGVSQAGLQQRSGVQQAEISRIEGGRLARGPTLATLVKLAHAQNLRLRISLVDPAAQRRRKRRGKQDAVDVPVDVSVIL